MLTAQERLWAMRAAMVAESLPEHERDRLTFPELCRLVEQKQDRLQPARLSGNHIHPIGADL